MEKLRKKIQSYINKGYVKKCPAIWLGAFQLTEKIDAKFMDSYIALLDICQEHSRDEVRQFIASNANLITNEHVQILLKSEKDITHILELCVHQMSYDYKSIKLALNHPNFMSKILKKTPKIDDDVIELILLSNIEELAQIIIHAYKLNDTHISIILQQVKRQYTIESLLNKKYKLSPDNINDICKRPMTKGILQLLITNGVIFDNTHLDILILHKNTHSAIDLIIYGVQPTYNTLLSACRVSNTYNLIQTIVQRDVYPSPECLIQMCKSSNVYTSEFKIVLQHVKLNEECLNILLDNKCYIVRDIIMEHKICIDIHTLEKLYKNGVPLPKLGDYDVKDDITHLELYYRHWRVPGTKYKCIPNEKCLENACLLTDNIKNIKHLMGLQIKPNDKCLENACCVPNNNIIINMLLKAGCKPSPTSVYNILSTLNNATALSLYTSCYGIEQVAYTKNDSLGVRGIED